MDYLFKRYYVRYRPRGEADTLGEAPEGLLYRRGEVDPYIENLQAQLARAIAIANVLSGAVEYDYHGEVSDPEEAAALHDLAVLEAELQP